MKRRFYCELILLFVFFTFSCSQERTDFSHDEYTVQITPVPAHPDDIAVFYAERPFAEPIRRIAVVFGYGYNDGSFISAVTEILKDTFGLTSGGGAVLPLVFPDDFKRGNTARISLLPSILEANDIDGLILLGAPEGTHSVLAKMQDSGGGNIGYPVFSLLPQDDLLGMEAGCDLVLEYMPSAADDTALAEERSVSISERIPDLLVKAVRYMTLLPKDIVHLSYTDGSDLLKHAQQLMGSGWTVLRYSDPETGLKPVNHFVIGS